MPLLEILKRTPYNELLTVRLQVIDEELLPVNARGRVWCAVNLCGHGVKIFIKPIIYLVATAASLVLNFASYLKGRETSLDLKQSRQFFVCAILSPFTEAANVCKAAMGIILPGLYYRPKYQGVALIDATYETSGEGNLDYSYVNPRLGFGFVLDGAGHGNPERKKIQDPIITQFIKSYQIELVSKKSDFNNVEEARQFVQVHMDAFGTEFNKVLPEYAPAIMFTQVIEIGNQRHLLMAHMADTALYIKTQAGWMTTAPQEDIGFGSSGISKGEINLPHVQTLELSPGDELVGFTDGIGEFLTMTECYAILNSNNDRLTLLKQFKQKIIAKGNEHAAKVQRGGD